MGHVPSTHSMLQIFVDLFAAERSFCPFIALPGPEKELAMQEAPDFHPCAGRTGWYATTQAETVRKA